MEEQTAEQVLQKLQDELSTLQLQQGNGLDSLDMRMPPASKGSGPRLFCGHVPKEATEDLVKAHFSRWGIVTDVYFPRHKKTLKRRPFCFVTFANRESAERALAESPLNICGIPIKNLTMVEDRDKYYKEKHTLAQQALLTALSNLGVGGAVPPDQVNNIAAVLAMEGISVDALVANLLPTLPQGQQTQYAQQVQYTQQQAQYTQQLQSRMPGYPVERTGSGGGGAADFILHQQQHRGGGEQAAAMSALRNPAMAPQPYTPASIGAGAFPSMMHRDSSMSSLSSQQSDWFSSTSSARNSLDLPPASFYHNQGQPMHHGGGGSLACGRLSVDAAMHLRQQVMAVAGQNSGYGGGQFVPGQQPGSHHYQQQQVHHQATAAAALQSAFYQPTMPPLSPPGVAGLQLPPIREGRPAQVDSWEQQHQQQGPPFSGAAASILQARSQSWSLPNSVSSDDAGLRQSSNSGNGNTIDESWLPRLEAVNSSSASASLWHTGFSSAGRNSI